MAGSRIPLPRKKRGNAFRPVAAYDGQGTLHVVWPAQVNGDWDLYWRANGTVQRITTAKGPDIHPNRFPAQTVTYGSPGSPFAVGNPIST